MASKRSGSGPACSRRPLTKAQLLPMDNASAREQSLTHHLALAACRDGRGNQFLFNELIRTTYIAWFLQRAGYGNEPVELFKAAEYAVEGTLAQKHETGDWSLDAEAVPIFETLLALHDAQLATVPLHKVLEAERRLVAFLGGTGSSPIPAPG